MSTLVDWQIMKLVRDHRMIEYFIPEQLNPASYDVRLGPNILVEGRVVGPKEARDRWLPVSLKNGTYYLEPGEFVLAETREYIRIPKDTEAVFQLKSSRGREGYEHALAGYIDPGFEGRVTLELANLNRRHSIPLIEDMLIGQLRFMKLNAVPSRSYAETGHYFGDVGVQPSKVLVE